VIPLSDPHDPHSPQLPPKPIRPTMLDELRIEDDPDDPVEVLATPTVVRRSDTTPAPHDAPSTRARSEPGDLPHLCRGCRYDLRGLPLGAHCPECGRKIPRKPRATPKPDQRLSVRESFATSWRGLAVPSLAPVLLLTPLPYGLPWGIVVPVCVGFAPAFRLLSMRRFEGLPEPFASNYLRPFRLARAMQWVEIAFAAAAALCAAVGSIGSLSDLFGKSWVAAYFLIVSGWWWIAIGSLRMQLSFGERVAEDMTDASALPHTTVRKAKLVAFLAQSLALVGIGFMAVGRNYDPTTDPEALFSPVGLGLVALASLGGVYVALVARGHASLVAECIHESPVLRLYDPIPTNPLIDEDDLGQPKPPPAATRFTPPGAAPDDDEPIPLA